MKMIDWVVILGMTFTGLIGVMIVGAAIVGSVAEQIYQWGGVVIGFFFGNFFSFLKDYVMKTTP